MTNGELAYLVLVIAAMVIFAATLAWVSRRPPSERRNPKETIMEFGIQFFPDVSPAQKPAAEYFAEIAESSSSCAILTATPMSAQWSIISSRMAAIAPILCSS